MLPLLVVRIVLAVGFLLAARGVQSVVHARTYRVAELFPVEVRVYLLDAIHKCLDGQLRIAPARNGFRHLHSSRWCYSGNGIYPDRTISKRTSTGTGEVSENARRSLPPAFPTLHPSADGSYDRRKLLGSGISNEGNGIGTPEAQYRTQLETK